MDRAIFPNLPVIPDEERRPEETFRGEFHGASPRILGALLDIVSDGLRRLPLVELPRKPRMVDITILEKLSEKSNWFKKELPW